MRIASGVTDQYIYFIGVDSADYVTRETGLTGFTVYRSRNGAAAAAMTTPTVNEVDSTNMPGVYELLCDEDMTIGSGNDEEEMVFHISATGMHPVTRAITLFRPKITAGYTLTVDADGGMPWNADWDAEVESEVQDVVGAAGASLTGIPWNSAWDAEVQSEVEDVVGTAGASLTGIPWNAAWDAEVESEVSDALGVGGANLTAVPWNAAWDAEVQSEVTDALNAYDPPSKAELDAAFTEIKGATWSAASDTLEHVRDKLTDIEADTNELQGDDVPGLISALDTVVDRVEADTQDIQSRLPAALVSGRMDSNLQAILGGALGETTAGRMAGNFDTFFENADAATAQTVDDVGGGGGGGGDATAANQSTIITHLTDIKGGSWSSETLKDIRDSLLTAAGVWTYSARTLTSMNNLDSHIDIGVQYHNSNLNLDVSAALTEDGAIVDPGTSGNTIQVYNYAGTEVIGNADWDSGPTRDGNQETIFARKNDASGDLSAGNLYFVRVTIGGEVAIAHFNTAN